MPDSNASYSEQELLGQIADGDQKAFTEFYHRYSPNIFSAAMVYTKDDIAFSEDIVQLVFVKAWEKRESLKEVRSVKDYLFIIARNMIFDQLKKMAREIKMKKTFSANLPADENDIDNYIREKEYNDVLSKAVKELPEQQRRVYKLSKDAGLSHEQIAEELHLSISTVHTHMKLATRSLRRYFNNHFADHLLWLIIMRVISEKC